MEKRIYKGTPIEYYKLPGDIGVFKLHEMLRRLLEEGDEVLLANPDVSYDGFAVYHYNNTTLMILYSENENVIKAFGSPENIKELEKGLVKKLKKAELHNKLI